MRTMYIAPTLGLLLLGAGCTAEPTLREQLLGRWDLVNISGYDIPGFVKSCGVQVSPEGLFYWACDSSYVASGDLTLQLDNDCVQTRVYETDTLTWSCTYAVNDNSASIQYNGGERFDLAVQGKDLWVSGPPCPFQDIVCSQYTEQYRKRTS